MSKMTKKALASSLKILLEQKPLSKITVTDIADKCGINRHTFYYHFQDIFELVEWVYLTEAEEAISAPGAPANWEEGLRRLFTYGLENKGFVLGTYESFQKDHLRQFTHKHVRILVEKIMWEHEAGLKLSEQQRKFAVDFYTYAFGGIVLSWVEGGMKEDPEELLKMLSVMLQETGRNAVVELSEL